MLYILLGMETTLKMLFASSGGNSWTAYSHASPTLTANRDAIEPALSCAALLAVLQKHYSTVKAMNLLSLTLAPVQMKTKAKYMDTLGPGRLSRERLGSPFWDNRKSLGSMLVEKFYFLGTERHRYVT